MAASCSIYWRLPTYTLSCKEINQFIMILWEKKVVVNSSKTRLFMLFGWDNIHSFAIFPLNSTGLIGCVALHDQINILGLPLPVYSVTENSILYLVYHLISHLYTCLAGAMYLFSIFICCWWCDDGYRGQALKQESTPNLPPSITISIFNVRRHCPILIFGMCKSSSSTFWQ